MYAKYVTNATSTAIQVANDLAKLCTGVDIASLSASCDKVNSQIQYNTVAPGWTVVDAAGPSSGTVISAPDAAGLYTKYINIYASTFIAITSYETYTVGTHAGTNITRVADFSASTSPAYATTGVQTYYVYATPRTIFIMNSTGTLCATTLEFSRDAQYLTSTSPVYPCHATGNVNFSQMYWNGNVYSLNITRIKNATATGDIVGTSAYLFTGTILPLYYFSGGTYVTTYPGTMRDSTDSPYHAIVPMFAMYGAGNTTQATPIGKIYDVQMTTTNYGAGLDTISDGVNNYVVFAGAMPGGAAHRTILKLA